jgi:hypothetical protein
MGREEGQGHIYGVSASGGHGQAAREVGVQRGNLKRPWQAEEPWQRGALGGLWRGKGGSVGGEGRWQLL